MTDWRVTSTESGWTNNPTGLRWLSEHFEPLTYTGRPRLLLMDGHGSHVAWEFLQYAIDHDISLVCLPPHTTHLLQPLDIEIFFSKAHWISEEMDSSRLLGAITISVSTILNCIAAARSRALTRRNILSAWKKTGIESYNPDLRLSDIQPATPPPQEPQQSSDDSDVLHTPRKGPEIDALLNYMLAGRDYSPKGLKRLAMLTKAGKLLAAKLTLSNRQKEQLRQAVDRRTGGRKGLVGPEGEVWTVKEGAEGGGEAAEEAAAAR